jgi:hypothetical protein
MRVRGKELKARVQIWMLREKKQEEVYDGAERVG